MTTSDTVTVQIPRQLYSVIEQRAQAAEFGSAEEYIIFALTTLTEEEASSEDEQPEMSAEEEGKVMERLRGLGYIE